MKLIQIRHIRKNDVELFLFHQQHIAAVIIFCQQFFQQKRNRQRKS